MTDPTHWAGRTTVLAKWLRLATLCAVAAVSIISMGHTLFPPRADLILMCSNDTRVCEQWQTGLKRDLGLDVRYVALPTQEALKRLQTSHTHPEFDLWVGGPSENYRYAAAQGLLLPITPPHASDLPPQFRDQHGRWFGVYASVLAFCSDPDALTKLHAPTPHSWKELTAPRRPGWISMPSPLSSGTGYATLLTLDAAGLSRTDITHLLGNVERFTRAGNAPSDIVARGEAAVAISYEPYCHGKTTRTGRPLTITHPREGTSYEIASGGVLTGTTHKTHATAAMNWLLSPTGQQAARQAGLDQAPVSQAAPGHIGQRLTTSHLPLLTLDPKRAETTRSAWMDWIAKQVWP
ncbi:extracellular solute-binding protein [Dermatophilus congolensis]|uniref:extracellular solute-binding protein n=1 Tax=Dermatophilus congolensis TaxID=1863 RepID=UPI001C68FC25|nr:extracellular solute-binding protein [Dermatophilus congolensis]